MNGTLRYQLKTQQVWGVEMWGREGGLGIFSKIKDMVSALRYFVIFGGDKLYTYI